MMDRSATDPLDGADIGETRTVRESVDLHTIEFEPEVFWGTDRFGDVEIDDVDVVEDENGAEVLTVTFEGEVTKALPRHWDYSREPLTDEEERSQKRKESIRKALSAGLVVGSLLVPLYIANRVIERMAGVTINGEPMQPPGIEAQIAVFAFAIFLVIAIPRLPGRIGGRSA